MPDGGPMNELVEARLSEMVDVAYEVMNRQGGLRAALTAAGLPELLAVVEAARHRGQCHGSVCDCDVKIRAALEAYETGCGGC